MRFIDNDIFKSLGDVTEGRWKIEENLEENPHPKFSLKF
jgi:hypothetical protein